MTTSGWISDCKRYIARVTPGDVMPDVVELEGERVWLNRRHVPTSFDDPMCVTPEFSGMPTRWTNQGRAARRTGRWIEAFEVKFCDFDMARVAPGATPILATHLASFRRRLPASHVRRRAAVDGAIERALAAERAAQHGAER